MDDISKPLGNQEKERLRARQLARLHSVGAADGLPATMIAAGLSSLAGAYALADIMAAIWQAADRK
jgi:hypothetical protein